MGQRNMVYNGPMLEMEHGHLHPEPCVVPYGGILSFPQPTSNHAILPPPGNRTSFNPQNIPENHGPLPHTITQYNSVDHHHHHHHHHHPANSIEYNNVFMTPTPGARVFPGAINHGIQDQLGSFERNDGQFMDVLNGVFKRKNAEGFIGNVPYFYPAPGSSSSVAIPTPWLDQQFCGNGSDGGAFQWNHAPSMPYLQGMEPANVGIHGYQVTPGARNSSAFVHPPPPPPHSLHHPPPPPMPPIQGHNMDFHPQLPPTSRRLPTSNAITPFPNGMEPVSGPRFVSPVPPTGLRVFRPHRRELMIEATARHRGFPHLRVLPEDGVAILDISGYHEVGHSVDHHRDMRLDIDHMSYEELLALGEQIGSVGSGLSDEFILQHLKTRVFASSKNSFDLDDASAADQELKSCVICQTNFDDQEHIGVLDCGHEYHVECVKKWLIVKNTCPVCKSTALAAQPKES